MAFGDLRDSFSGQSSSVGSTLSATGSVEVIVGDLIVAVFAQRNSLSVTGVTDNLGNSYTAQNAGTDAGDVTGRMFYSVVTVAGTLTTVTASLTAGSHATFPVAVFEGNFLDPAIDKNPANITSDITTPYNCPPTGTLTQAKELVIGWAATTSAQDMTAGTGYTLAISESTPASTASAIVYRATSVTTTTTPSLNQSGSTLQIVLGTATFMAGVQTYSVFVDALTNNVEAVARRKGALRLVNATSAQTLALLVSPHLNFARTLAALQGRTSRLNKAVGKRATASQPQTATVLQIKAMLRLFAATTTQAVSVSNIKSFQRTIAAVTAQAAAISRAQFRRITGTSSQTAAVTSRSIRSKIVTAALAQTVRVTSQLGLRLATSLGQVLANIRRRIRAASGETEPALIRAGRNLFLITIQGHDGGTVQTLRFQSGGLRRTVPADTPPRTYFEPRVVDPGNFERYLFSSGRTRGQSSVGVGDVVLASGDRGRMGNTLDYLLGWAFDGYQILIQSLTSSRQMVVNATTLFTGTIEQPITDDAYNKISFKIHDRLSDLDQPLLQLSFGGTTTSGGMGTADGNEDLAGQKIQSCYGTCFNAVPQVSNPFDLVFRFSDGPLTSIAAFDGGVALTNAGDTANLAALLAWVQVAGQYKTCLSIGSIRTGSTPTFALTADVVEGANAAARTAAQIVKRMLLSLPDIDIGDLDDATFTALDADNDAECGIVVIGDTSCLNAATDVLGSIGGYLVPDRTGIFQVGRLEMPSGDPVVEINEDIIIGDSLERFAVRDDGSGIPTWRFTLNYARNNKVQDQSELAGAVTAERGTFVASQWRTAVASDPAVMDVHLRATDVTLDTYLTDVADADAEAARLLALYSTSLSAYRVELPLEYGDDAELGSVVSLTSPRFDLGNGKLFAVIGRVDDYERKIVQVELWGGVTGALGNSGEPIGLLLTLTQS